MNARVDLDPPTKTWARARLRLGQANVGTWVLLGTWLLVARPEAAVADPTWGGQAAGWAGLVLLWMGLQAPFDVIGGYVLPVRHGRREPGVPEWLGAWARGAAVHALTVIGVGWAVLAAAGAWGTVGALVLVALALVAQLALQGPLLRLSTGARAHTLSTEAREVLVGTGLDPETTTVLGVDDRGFVGGWMGLPGRERLVLPAWWTRDVALLRVVARRRARALGSGARGRGAWGAVLFQLVGWGLVVALLGDVRLDTALGLAKVSAGITVWGFLGLLTLPSLSRRAVHAVDREAAAELSRAHVADTLRRLDRDQEDEDDDARGAWTGTIFHPVPTPSRRMAALDAPAGDGLAFWRITRMGLYLGWSTGSWLSRAVHCNAGRPELWVVLPGD